MGTYIRLAGGVRRAQLGGAPPGSADRGHQTRTRPPRTHPTPAGDRTRGPRPSKDPPETVTAREPRDQMAHKQAQHHPEPTWTSRAMARPRPPAAPDPGRPAIPHRRKETPPASTDEALKSKVSFWFLRTTKMPSRSLGALSKTHGDLHSPGGGGSSAPSWAAHRRAARTAGIRPGHAPHGHTGHQRATGNEARAQARTHQKRSRPPSRATARHTNKQSATGNPPSNPELRAHVCARKRVCARTHEGGGHHARTCARVHA